MVVILSLCLAFLLFIATNQNALAKVHQTISTFSKMSSVSATEKMLDITTSHTKSIRKTPMNAKWKHTIIK